MSIKKTLLYVEWQDHFTFQDNVWRDPDEFDGLEPFVISSVGWLLREDKNVLCIAAHVGDAAERVTGEMMILKKAIIKRCVLKCPK